MSNRNRFWLAGVLAVMTLPALADSNPAPDRGDRVDQRLDRRGERIDNRFDRRGDHIENRLDRRGDRFDRRFDRRHARRG